jgi:TrmH family RNA methyltransferase
MDAMKRITASENRCIKSYRKLASSKRERQKQGCFVLEGLRLVTDAVKNGGVLTHLFFTEEGYQRWQAENVQADLRETQCALLSNELGTALSQTEHSQGVYAICRIPAQQPLETLIQPHGNYGILYQLQDPGNAGMILRTADALGLDGVIYAASCDIYSPKVVRATMGSLFRMSVCCVPTLEPVLTACRNAGVETCAAVIDRDAQPVGTCSFSGGTAILIGNEGNGLPTEVASACDRRVTIPMHGNIESLNAAMAAGIILWEVQKNR